MEGKISAITRQKGDKARASIFIEGAFAFGIEEQTIEEFRLRKGDYIDRELIDKLLDFDLWIGAKRIGLRYVDRRARSEKEIRRRLDREEIPTEIVDRVVEYLKGYNLVNDSAYSQAFVRDKLRRKSTSSFEIRHDLGQRGIPKPIIEETLARLNAEESDASRAFRAGQKRWPRLQREEPLTQQRKLYAFLAGRGFSREIIKETYKRLSGAELGEEG